MAADTSAPVLNDVDLDRDEVTINGQSVTINVTADLSDAGGSHLSTGVNGPAPIQVIFTHPSGQQVFAIFYIDPGTDSGTFVTTLTLSEFAAAGEWTAQYAFLNDMAGNQRILSADDPLLKDSKFTVTNAASDTSPPSLESIQIVGSGVVDIDSGQTQLIVRMHVTDPSAGLFDGTYVDGLGGSPSQIMFRSASGQLAFGIFEILDPVSGNRNDGVFDALVTLEDSAEPGTWTVDHLFLQDEAGNMVTLGPDDAAAVAAINFTVKNSFGDAGPPVVDWISFGNPTLNADGSSQFIVEAHLIDDKSGLSDGITAGGIGVSPSQIRFVSESGQRVDGIFDINPVSGTLTDGVFRATVTLSAFAETGIWRVEHVFVADEAGNFRYYTPEDDPNIPKDAIHLGTDLPDTITGTPGEEAIYGYGGNDALGGAGGDDTLNGGDGDDTVDGGTGDDTIVGGHGAGNDVYKGGAGFDRVTYTSAKTKIKVDLEKGKASGRDIDKDKLVGIEGVLGGQAGDTIRGSKAANILDGHTGKDKLTGGKGKDTFVFSTELGQKNVDAITDFKRKDDTIALDDYVFSGLATGKLAKGAFVVGKAAKDKDDRIVYDKKKGVLIYDDNGSQKGGDTVFAKVGKGTSVGADDFIIV